MILLGGHSTSPSKETAITPAVGRAVSTVPPAVSSFRVHLVQQEPKRAPFQRKPKSNVCLGELGGGGREALRDKSRALLGVD